jgi:hypothetical protein
MACNSVFVERPMNSTKNLRRDFFDGDLTL